MLLFYFGLSIMHYVKRVLIYRVDRPSFCLARQFFAPNLLYLQTEIQGLVAQLNSASDYGSEGYRFESCRGHTQ